MFIKIIKSYRNIVAICDSEILGKKFEQGKFQLEVKESFFKGEKTSENKAIEIMQKMSQEDATFNIVGDKSIKTAIKAGIITDKEIIKIQGVPFALILL